MQPPDLLFLVVLCYILHLKILFFANFYSFIQHLKKKFFCRKFSLLADSLKRPPLNGQNLLSVTKVFV